MEDVDGQWLVVTALLGTQIDRFWKRVLKLASVERLEFCPLELRADERSDLRNERLGRHIVAWVPSTDKVLGYAHITFVVSPLEGRVAQLRLLLAPPPSPLRILVQRDLIVAALAAAFHGDARVLEMPHFQQHLEFLLSAGDHLRVGGRGITIKLPWLPDDVSAGSPTIPVEVARHTCEFPRILSLPSVRRLELTSELA